MEDNVTLVVDEKDPLFDRLSRNLNRLDEYTNYQKFGNTPCISMGIISE